MIIAHIILVILTYLASIFPMWNYLRIAYSKGGIWFNTTPAAPDYFFMLIPGINLAFGCISWIIRSPYTQGDIKRQERMERLSTFIFGIKK